jgi:TatD DNase family protein
VLETDAPDIPPAWAVRQRNVPAYLGGIARTLAQLRGVPVDEVAERTTENARSVLPVIGALIDRTGSAGRAPDVSNETRIAAGTRS